MPGKTAPDQCPECGSDMWDNRLTKRNPRSPDYVCKDRSCNGVVWPPKGGRRNTRQQGGDPYESSDPGPEQPRRPSPADLLTAPLRQPPPSPEARRLFLHKHLQCFKYAMQHYIPLLTEMNIPPTMEGLAILADSLYSGQEEAR